jgi:hypothetical protein
MAVPYPNINGKQLADGANALATETAFNTARDKTIQSGAAGKIGFIAVDGTNQLKFDFALQPAFFITSSTELTNAQAAATPTDIIYDVPNQVAYSYNGSAWVADTTHAPVKDKGSGRMFITLATGKVFYVESEWEIYLLNGVAMS